MQHRTTTAPDVYVCVSFTSAERDILCFVVSRAKGALILRSVLACLNGRSVDHIMFSCNNVLLTLCLCSLSLVSIKHKSQGSACVLAVRAQQLIWPCRRDALDFTVLMKPVPVKNRKFHVISLACSAKAQREVLEQFVPETSLQPRVSSNVFPQPRHAMRRCCEPP